MVSGSADSFSRVLILLTATAITKAHMKLPELESSVREGRLVPDGKVCLNESGELAVTKFAVEPVWYLPGVAERFGIDEGTLRRSLFEHTGGSYPELITRNDIKIFLPPIGGLTVYCFGDPKKMSDESVRLALRVHDECNGSDVFGSDICTCRPYLIYGIEEAVKEAQKGGSGVVIYFRKEGRALGEVTKVCLSLPVHVLVLTTNVSILCTMPESAPQIVHLSTSREPKTSPVLKICASRLSCQTFSTGLE